VAEAAHRSCIYVIAGTNGAGKSSIAGSMFVARGAEYFNPDSAARSISESNPGISQSDANSAAWHQGKRLLERAIAERLDFAFETTLGGKTITAMLEKALSNRIEVRVWYVGLNTPELHIARVRARYEQGGHSIPEEKIRQRYVQSRLNLIRLIPRLTELLVYDNSDEADPAAGKVPKLEFLLHFARGRILRSCPLGAVPEWAKPIFAAALKLSG
jgi:predicted ABC-type ATPase